MHVCIHAHTHTTLLVPQSVGSLSLFLSYVLTSLFFTSSLHFSLPLSHPSLIVAGSIEIMCLMILIQWRPTIIGLAQVPLLPLAQGSFPLTTVGFNQHQLWLCVCLGSFIREEECVCICTSQESGYLKEFTVHVDANSFYLKECVFDFFSQGGLRY